MKCITEWLSRRCFMKKMRRRPDFFNGTKWAAGKTCPTKCGAGHFVGLNPDYHQWELSNIMRRRPILWTESWWVVCPVYIVYKFMFQKSQLRIFFFIELKLSRPSVRLFFLCLRTISVPKECHCTKSNSDNFCGQTRFLIGCRHPAAGCCWIQEHCEERNCVLFLPATTTE